MIGYCIVRMVQNEILLTILVRIVQNEMIGYCSQVRTVQNEMTGYCSYVRTIQNEDDWLLQSQVRTIQNEIGYCRVRIVQNEMITAEVGYLMGLQTVKSAVTASARS